MGWNRTFVGVFREKVMGIMLVHKFIMVSRDEINRNIETVKDEKNLEMLSNAICKGKKCVKVADDIILNNYEDFMSGFPTHWFSISNLEKGLNYYGITIILNEELPMFIKMLYKHKKKRIIKKLIKICEEAFKTKKDVVHFGI